MKYLVNRKTKEHRIDNPEAHLYHDWRIVEADSDGWIAWDCEADLDCPISKEQLYQARLRNGKIVDRAVRWDCYDNDGDVMAYRPILTEKVQEPEPIPAPDYDPRSVSFNLIDRLKAAHEAAQQIPDLEAELREVLGGMGYRLDKLSPFVEPEAVVEPAQDMKYVMRCLRCGVEEGMIHKYSCAERMAIKNRLAKNSPALRN